jgi:hypothetical protein
VPGDLWIDTRISLRDHMSALSTAVNRSPSVVDEIGAAHPLQMESFTQKE